MVRIAAIAPWAALLPLLATAGAAAHPLGNFTINHLARIEAGNNQLRVHYVLDIAEIPTFQIMHAQGAWTPQRARAWGSAEAALVAEGLSVQANGAVLALHLEGNSSRTRAGAGGLPILYWTGDYTAPLPPKASVSVRDSVYADRRIGWKDVVLPGTIDPTNELRSYPSALIGSPRRNDQAAFDVVDGRIAHVRVSGDDSAQWGAASVVKSSVLSDLVARSGQTPLLVLLTILAAFGLGALHGLEPGHGKALLAFTLVGARATFKQAVILAGALTFAHTIAVLLLGALLFVAAGFATESLFTWISLLSGLAVMTIGARSLSVAVVRATHDREHARAHAHGLDHEHAHGHSHAIPGSTPLQFRAAVVAAMSGGIAPCPAAIVVLLTALRLHRVGYGLMLIVIFSLGLAAILTGLGLAVVHGADWLARRSGFERVAHLAPFITASVISIIGASMLATGIVNVGVHVWAPGLVAFALLAVASFAFFPLLLRSSTHRSFIIEETT